MTVRLVSYRNGERLEMPVYDTAEAVEQARYEETDKYSIPEEVVNGEGNIIYDRNALYHMMDLQKA